MRLPSLGFHLLINGTYSDMFASLFSYLYNKQKQNKQNKECYLRMALLGLFVNIWSFINVFFFPQNNACPTMAFPQNTVGCRDSFTTFKNLFKSLLPGRKHQEGKGEQLWIPLYLQNSSVPLCLGWDQAVIASLSLTEKKTIFHVKQRPFILWLPLFVPGHTSCFFLAFSNHKSNPNP